LAAAAAPREVRKVVTVLFCDLTGSTALGERTDPETLRALMRRYYETSRVVLERHGGTVEKFVGDAVMAVFGIPVATEDDALRAVRAAVELRDTVHELGLDGRIGVNTGEVVAGEGDTLVTGDAVNVAARLEQVASGGDVLLGSDTLELVRDAVQTEPVELTLKGKAGTVIAHRLLVLDIVAAGVARRLDRVMIGRERERQRLRADFADAAASRTSRLFTLIGPAGVGKSRLVADFLEHVADQATVARGRALSYGEGITYWPLVEILAQLGIDAGEAIRSSPADTQLATRALLERVADERPLVLVLDDLQWAEPPLLDLVEHLADWSREAPIFLLCIARPELLDARPGWGGGKLNATSVLLEPLGSAEANVLADELLRDIELPTHIRDRILEIAEGNPLFLAEMAALAREGPQVVAVPATIHAVLQARLDTLTDDERGVIERGSVEGKVFHRGSVTALAPVPDREHVPSDLLALVRKELVRPDRSQLGGDDAFRFRHLLIRDTAYESLPKAVRADLHERFASWLDGQVGLAERDEIVGFHLEQAATYLRELDPTSTRAATLAEQAGGRLGTAGSAAYERGDLHAMRNLLGRAIAVLPEGPERRRLLPDLVEALDAAGEREAVSELIAELERGDAADRARAVVLRLLIDPLTGRRAIPDLLDDLDDAQRELEREGGALDVVRCERARGMLSWAACRADQAHAAYRRAYELLRELGRPALQRDVVDVLGGTSTMSGASLAEVRALMDRIAADLLPDAGPLLAASLAAGRSKRDIAAGLIEPDEARRIHEHLAQLLGEVGSERGQLGARGFLPVLAQLEGDDAEAERIYRELVAAHERLNNLYVLVNTLASWSLSLSRLGNTDAALRAVARGRQIVRDEDIADQINLDLAEARALAAQGDHEAARVLVDRARRTSEGMVMVLLSDEIDAIDAEVRRFAGDDAGADAIGRAVIERLSHRGALGIAAGFGRRLGLAEPGATRPT
jgi:class 3 adenylate cyclase/tetratricopeptide (TPR) repeat protein